MYLIEKSGRKRKICRVCLALHGPADCPRGPAAKRQKSAHLAWQRQYMRELRAMQAYLGSVDRVNYADMDRFIAQALSTPESFAV